MSRELMCLIDTAADLLTPFRKEFAKMNERMAAYEQKIGNKPIKKRARCARLELKEAVIKYNKIMADISK